MEELASPTQNICSGCSISYSESKHFTPEKVFDFLVKHGVLVNTMKCPNCGHVLKLNESSKMFRCPKYVYKNKKAKAKCNFVKSAHSNTFFHQSKVPESTMFKLVSAFLLILPPRNAVILQDVGIKDTQLPDLFVSIREVFIHEVSSDTSKLGGKNLIVELAEAKWRCDNLRGGLWDWAFGAIEHQSRKTFLVPVERLSFETLKDIISQRINPETTIVTDCTNNLTSEQIKDIKETLNVSFVHPANSTVAEDIKRHWGQVRKGYINLASKRPPNSIDQLAEYLFKSKYPVHAERIHAYFVAARTLYPPDAVSG